MKFVCSLICLFAYLFIAPSGALAAGEFGANYDIQYAVSPAGKTIVTQRVYLVNKLSNFYPQSYSLLIDSDKISNIIAYDDGGVITPTISVKDGKTTIGLHFNTKAVGLGKSLGFTLRYEHAGVASQNGSIWELYIPGIVNDPDIGDYNVTLNVPPTFGPVSYISPLPAANRTWTKDQMIRGGVAAAYGTAQNFRVALSYTLINSSLVRQKQEIALPPETAFQKVSILSLEPKPESVTADGDGNWLATYEVLPAQSLSIQAGLAISLYLSPRPEYIQPPVQSALYLKPLPYWQSADPNIVNAAQSLTSAREIYDYVVQSLQYDYSRVSTATKRLGALSALSSPTQAICMEFTDLFIALARASGIPARRAVGYAYTNNPKLRPLSLVSDVLHAWPEYYDPVVKLWIPVDPTWADTTGGVDYFTKMDYNHLTFAINGLDSQTPYPAGFYHAPNKTGKDVIVEFAPQTVKISPAKINTSIEFPSQTAAGTVAHGNLIVSNVGGETAVNISVSATSDIGGMTLVQTIPSLLPFGSVKIPIQLTPPQQLHRSSGTIRAVVNDTEQLRQFSVHPLYWLIAGIGLGAVALGYGLVVMIRYLLWKQSHKQ